MNLFPIVTIIPDNMAVIEAARLAHSTGRMLITNGSRSLVSPNLLPGYRVLYTPCTVRQA